MPQRAIILVLTLFAMACGPPASARFEVDGVAEAYAGCFEVAFPFVPIFHAYRERSDSVGLFLQSRGGNVQFVDMVTFEIFDPDRIELGTPIPLESFATRESQVVAGLELGESCPQVGILEQTPPNTPTIEDVPLIEGNVTFEQFSQEVDGVIDGTVDGRLVNPVTGEIAAESFTGEFNFTVQVGQPYEEFRN